MFGNSVACRLAHLRPELALLRAPGGPLGCRREAACGSLSRRRPRGVGTCASAGVPGWPDNTNGPSKVIIGRGAPLAEDRWCGGQGGPLPAVPARSVNVNVSAPCVICGQPATLRSPRGKPCHWTCALAWTEEHRQADDHER